MRVLVVNDEPFAASALSAILGRAGCAVETITSAQASERLTRDLPDVLVIEWLLADVDGTTLVREVRKRFGQKPSIVLTSPLSEEPARTHAKRVGADEYVLKPIGEDALLAALGRCGVRSGGATPSAGFTQTQRAIFSHGHWTKFETLAAKHVSEFLHVAVEGSPAARSTPELGWLCATLGMYDVGSSLEAEITLACSPMTGKKLARPLFRDAEPDDQMVREMLSEMCNNVLGRAKAAFRIAGFRFLLGLPDEHRVRGEHPMSKTASLSGAFGTVYAFFGVRPINTSVVRGSELRENMVLAEDVKTDAGEMVYAAGTRLTSAAIDRLVRHLALRQVKVSTLGP